MLLPQARRVTAVERVGCGCQARTVLGQNVAMRALRYPHRVSRREHGKVRTLCCICPCVPLLRAQDLRGAFELFAQRQADCVYPVVAFHSSPWCAMSKPEQGPMAFVYPEHELTRTQDLPKGYFDAGQFYWGRTAACTSRLTSKA